MTAEKADSNAAHENPLIPNARLRQLYRAILRAHLLGRALPPAQRALTAAREAALVSTSIGLESRDLISDAFSTPALDFLRGTPLHRALRPKSKSSAARIVAGRVIDRRVIAACGSASRIPAPADAASRLHAALGAAAALQSIAAVAKSAARKEEKPAGDSAVVVCYALPNAVSAAAWKSALTFAAEHELPILFVLLPSASAKKTAQQAASLRELARRAQVPAIPVDAADPVALYRVAQESIGHARIGGGPALIECISFLSASDDLRPSRAAGSSHAPPHAAPPLNAALATLEQYILQRGVATRGWMDREAAAFSAQIRKAQSASK